MLAALHHLSLPEVVMRRSLSSIFTVVLVSTAIAALALLPPPADAGLGPPNTWTGMGANPNWSTAGNWDAGVPEAGDDLFFPAGAPQSLTGNNDLLAGTTFYRMNFTGTGGGYAIGGNGISVLAGIIATNGAVNQLNLPISLGNPNTFSTTSDLRLFGAITISGANTLTLSGSGAGTVLLGGAVSGTGGLTSSAGQVFVVNDKTYTGPTNVTAGTLVVHQGNLDPASVVTVSGSSALQIANGRSVGPVTVQSPSTLFIGGGGGPSPHIGNVTSLSMNSGSQFQAFMANDSSYSRLNASGNVDLGGAALFILSPFFTSSTGQMFTIIESTGTITGTYNGLPNGADIRGERAPLSDHLR